MADMRKSPEIDVEPTLPTDKRTASLSVDPHGATVIVKEDGDTICIDKAAERRLLWKFDSRILPLLAMMYLFNSLDKSNLGNAKTNGLERDLDMVGTNKW